MRRTIAPLLCLSLAACGAATPRPAVPGSDVVTMEEMRIVASTGGEGDLAVIDWKQVWMVPCIFAGVIMVIFFLFFRDPGRKSKAGVPAVDEMDERTTM